MSEMKLTKTDSQVKIEMEKPVVGRFSLKDAGLNEDFYKVEGGNLRIKVEMGYIQDFHLYKMPIIELDYTQKIHESEWVVEFNGENILEKKDHSGQSTVLLLKRSKMNDLLHRHENTLLIHADFSEEVEIKNSSSMVLIEEPGN